MKKIIYSVIALLVITKITYAQRELQFEFDYAKFNYDTSSVYLEFYYTLNTVDMQIINNDKELLNEAIVHIEMKNNVTNEFFINKDWKIQNSIDINGNTGTEKSLAGVLSFVVPNGKYSLEVKAYDKNNPSFSKIINETVAIESFPNNKLSISDIEIANRIKNDNVDQNSIFYKNTLEIIPNPAMIYSNLSPVMFYYAELYNLKQENGTKEVSLQKILYNSLGAPVYNNSKKINPGNASIIEYGVINLSKYPTDSYNFELSLVDPSTKQAYVSSKRFYFYNPNVVDTNKNNRLNAGVLGSEFAILTNEECDKMFAEAKYIATRDEIIQYKKIDSLNVKREFIYNFWISRDTDPSTAKNEFKEEYMRRVSFVNKNFSSLYKEGYTTDRGRVVLLYGEPDQRDFYPSDAGYKPYEIWIYNDIEGGVAFYFGDVTGYGNYELLNSTKRGEVRDDNWMRRITTM